MAFDREAARQAGYSDAEIDAYLREERNKKRAPAPTTTAEESDTPPDSTTVVPEAGSGVAGGVTTTAMALAPHAATGAGIYTAYKLGKPIYEKINQRLNPVAPSIGTPGNPIGGNAPLATAPGPVAPAAPAPTMAPAAAPAQAAEASLLDKTSAMIRQLAASKVLQNVAKGGVGLGAAMYSPSTGPAVPSTGRMKGMEINPVTGRPWTPEQIQQYEANPSMYDAQLGASQFR